ncbi:hypothetical protein BGZ63DRAFT_8647 [Mariannaea sp. PMI_226]|nr:hypothetical protein BGZ63DRAFT_8647 [Mariannaea sp. PMI_226]
MIRSTHSPYPWLEMFTTWSGSVNVSRFELPVPIATIQKQWWEYAQTDTLLMHSTLSVSAAMWGATARLPPIIVKEGWRQKGLALRGVQEKLDQGDGSMTLVGTIGNLANLEGVEGNFQVARLHLQGLDRIVRKWPDGYKAIQSNVNVARTINWADIQAATGLGMKPLLPLVFSLDSVVLPLSILTAAEQPSLHHLEEFERSCNNTAVRFCFSLTRQSVIAARHKEVAGDDFRILMNSADHFISTTLGGDSLTELGRALVTAASVSYYALVRQVPLRALLPRILVRRLHKQLDLSMDEFRSNPTYHPGLIWALLVGAAASYETREGFDFFSSNLLMMLIIGNIHKRADLEALAKRFIFHDNFPGSFFRQYGTSLFPQTIERA